MNMQEKYQQEFERYKDVPLPSVDETFRLKSNPAILLVVRTYDRENEKGLVETVSSGRQKWRTFHWIRKNRSR